MLNGIFLGLIVLASLVGAYTGTMAEVSQASIDSAKSAVELAIGLVGQMALWLGLAEVLQAAGLMTGIARALRPIMTRLFPDVPAEHPAMGAMIMNIAANMLGLANAATPFGIKAMIELNRLNRRPGVATNAMVLFLTVNTSGVAVLPTGVIAIRASMGAADPAGIFFPSMLATASSTLVGIFVCLLLARLPVFKRELEAEEASEAPEIREIHSRAVSTTPDPSTASNPESTPTATATWQPKRVALALLIILLLLFGLARWILRAPESDPLSLLKTISSAWILPGLIVGMLLVGYARGVAVYETAVKGAKQGFQVAITIIPFLVAILVAIGMFRASGAMTMLVETLGPITSALGFPVELLPMAIVRPLSGSGALGVLMETMKAYGPDSFVGFAVGVMQGSTETTFYVLAVYLGAVGVSRSRHAVFSCLAADVAGMFSAIAWSRLFF